MLNAQTKPDRYPIPFLTDFAYQLHGTMVFSTIDLVKAYHQIPINEDDIPKTAICTPFGLFEFTRMTFGLRNAAQSFQRCIHAVVRNLNFCFPYIDDLLIASHSMEEHLDHLKTVFERLTNAGLIINVSKCVFASPKVTFLGHEISSEGIKPSEAKVEAINSITRPQTIKALRSFLGMINFYRKFIPNAAEEQAILNELLKGSRKNDKREVDWTTERSDAFELCKTKLKNAVILAHPSSEVELAVMVDASNTAIGAVVQQRISDKWTPLGFFSVKLNDTLRKYSAYDRELLAAYSSIKHFKHLLEARSFILFTDHKPLIFALQQNLDKASPRQRRHLDFISQYTTDIRHISGKDNLVADALSRMESITLDSSIDYVHLARDQSTDTTLANLLETNKSLIFQKFPIFGTESEIYCDISTGSPRPYVTENFRRVIFDSVHKLSHPSIRTTTKMVTKKFVWPEVNKDVRNMSKSCVACQKAKVSRHVKSPIGEYLITSKRFDEIHLDIIGPLPPSDGNRFCVTLIDRYTRWPEVIPVADIKATTVATAIFKEWICRFGVPSSITTDRGSQFESALFTELAMFLGFKHKRTTAYNPACNGMIERWHRSLKAALGCHNNPHWSRVLPIISLGLRTAVKEELKVSPAQLVYGECLRLPGDFFVKSKTNTNVSDFIEELRKHFNSIQPTPATRHSNNDVFVFKELKSCSHVFVRVDSLRGALQLPYEGPFEVIQRNTKYFTVKMRNREVNISINRLKPCFSSDYANNPIDMPSVTPQVVIQVEAEQQSLPNKTVTFSQLPPVTSESKSGRQIKRPSRFNE